MARTKATIRRINDFRTVARGRKRTVCPFKTKQTLLSKKLFASKRMDKPLKPSMYEENLHISQEKINLFFNP